MNVMRRLRRLVGRDTDGYRLRFPRRVNRRRLLREIADLTGAPRAAVRRWFADYRELHRREGYERRFGERKTLNFEEAFVIYAILAHTRPPRPIVEIGTQYGRSTRRILDILDRLDLKNDVVCFDIEDRVEAFAPDEAALVVEDITGRFRERVLDRIHPCLIYLDAHPYRLTKEVILDVLQHTRDCVLVMHDSGKALCNPDMALDRDDPDITSATGHWERHVLCEVFGVDDPMTNEIDYRETQTHRLRVFRTVHGLATIVPRP